MKNQIIINIILLLFIFITYNVYQNINHKKNKIYVTLTTIPERLVHPWFYENLKNLLDLNYNYNVVLNIPNNYKKTGEKYIIPKNIIELQKSKNLFIYRIKEDYGPLTKLIGALLNDNIDDNDALIICDDDIMYYKNFVSYIYKEYTKDTNKLYTYCNTNIAGYKGFIVKKKLIKPILYFPRPKSCFRIDDNYIEEYIKVANINVKYVPYNNNTSWKCSFDKAKTDTHPKWNELMFDDREPMIKECINDLRKKNLFYLG